MDGSGARSGTGDDLPLQGVKVLDMSRHLPGPWCAQYLGDFGADVIKVEHLGIGDPSRYNPPLYARDSVYFHSVNSAKRSIAIDLGNPAAQAAKERLLHWSDVVVESFRPGGAAKLGVGYEQAAAINPRIIYCSISGFGRTGPYAHSPGHDLAIQSLTGLLGGSFLPGDFPRNPSFHAADYAGGATAVMAILAAYVRMLRSGKGALLDISMYDSVMSMLEIRLSGALGRAANLSDRREIEVWGNNPRYRCYATGDGKAVTVGLLEPKVWAKFCRHIGREDLISDKETLEDRLTSHSENGERYRSVIADYCLTKSRDEIAGEMRDRGIPITPVLDPDEAVSSDIATSRSIVARVPDRVEGDILHLANPLQHSGLVRSRDSGPALGGHTQEILSELGFDEQQIGEIKRAGAI
jgi:crotonobetainyl-CoA:carnitine CoA-transferase CaiB-like acyl-CoA transferase